LPLGHTGLLSGESQDSSMSEDPETQGTHVSAQKDFHRQLEPRLLVHAGTLQARPLLALDDSTAVAVR
jgi:hypothetical protein